jgi:hypothetical protein
VVGFASARDARFFAFHRALDLRCLRVTIFALLVAILLLVVDVVNRCHDSDTRLVETLTIQYQFQSDLFKTLETFIELICGMLFSCHKDFLDLIDFPIRREVFESIPRP